MKIHFLILTFALFSGSACAQQQAATESPQAKAKKLLATLSLERKVAQLVCAQIQGDATADDPRLKAWISLVKDHGIGGLVISGGTAQSAAALINKLQEAATIPILISADFGGGPGQQFKGASEFPPNMAFAATRSDDLMFRAAQIMAKEGRSIGVRLSYTPSVDIHVSPDNPQESGRSFGSDLTLLNSMIKAYVAGYHKEGMLVTAKHFPGRGDMSGGPSDSSFTILSKDAKQLEQQELRAFSQAVAAGVDLIMTDHIAAPGLADGSTLPASVEPKLVRGVLREKLKYNGLITTNDLSYNHIVARFGRDDVAVLAIEAGHDIVLNPKDPVAAMKALVTAVKTGRIHQADIDSSVYKLLLAKISLGLPEHKTSDLSKIESSVGIEAHRQLVQDVADRSVTLLKNEQVFPLTMKEGTKLVHITVQKTVDQPNVEILKKMMENRFRDVQQFSIVPGQNKKIYADMLKASGTADVIVVSLFVQRDRYGDPAPLSREVAGLLDGMAGSFPGKVVMMSFGNPFLIQKLSKARCFFVGYGEGGGYGNQTVYFDSFIRVLKGELKPTGKLPIAVSEQFPFGSGIQLAK